MTVEIVVSDRVLGGLPPRDENGRLYRYEMTFGDGRFRAYADTFTELCGALLGESYTDLDDEDVAGQVAARIGYAVAAATVLQAQTIVGLAERVPPGGITDEEYAVLDTPRDEPPRIRVWGSQVPLFLVDAFYEPFTDVPRPVVVPRVPTDTPTIWWIRVGDEEEFLLSLDAVGAIRLAVAEKESESLT